MVDKHAGPAPGTRSLLITAPLRPGGMAGAIGPRGGAAGDASWNWGEGEAHSKSVGGASAPARLGVNFHVRGAFEAYLDCCQVGLSLYSVFMVVNTVLTVFMRFLLCCWQRGPPPSAGCSRGEAAALCAEEPGPSPAGEASSVQQTECGGNCCSSSLPRSCASSGGGPGREQ